MNNVATLIDDRGSISVGPLGSIACATRAAESHNSPAMLLRRDDETLNALLKRMDRAIVRCCYTGKKGRDQTTGRLTRVRREGGRWTLTTKGCNVQTC